LVFFGIFASQATASKSRAPRTIASMAGNALLPIASARIKLFRSFNARDNLVKCAELLLTRKALYIESE